MATDDVIFDAYIWNQQVNTIQYEGTSDCGVIFQLAVNRIMSNFTIYNIQPDGIPQTFSVTGSFAPGDVVTVNSIPGQKVLTLSRGGITTSILFYADPSNQWPTLQRGENDFYVLASGASIPYTLTYTPKYGAI